ncbi:MAG: leishmanolysin-related zinc metalloendopeptidase [Microthrixaceae bacterium]
MKPFTVAAIAALALTACAPAPRPGDPTPSTGSAPVAAPPAPGPGSPVIGAFSASATAAPSPLTTALRWDVSDPDGDALQCVLHLDDGSEDQVVNGCDSGDSRARTITATGARTATLSVTDGGTTVSSSLQLNVAAPSVDPFGITLRLSPGMTAEQSAAFDTAANRWDRIVRTGLADQPLSFAANYCADGLDAYSGTVDDLLIDVLVRNIDGPGGILGQAGPCLLRGGGGLPVYGIMVFDSSDLTSLQSQGLLVDTITHEMGHVLGIGTVWNASDTSGLGSANPLFTGPVAGAAYNALGGSGAVPLENTGGSGTADSHWRESVFGTALMTGWIDTSNQLSTISVGALADMGYGVDLSAADPYTLPAPSLLSSVRGHGDPTSQRATTELVTPKGEVTTTSPAPRRDHRDRADRPAPHGRRLHRHSPR